MDVIRSKSATDSVAAAIGSSGATLAGGSISLRERPLPTAAAMLWTPLGRPAPEPASPIFITQQALEAVHAQVAAHPAGASSLGFLVGAVWSSPGVETPSIVVESTIHIPWAIAGDHLESALRQGLAIANSEVERSGSQLLGWYHSLVTGPARLSPADVQAHAASFEQPWSIALVVARGTELTGGVFRVGSDADRPPDPLPFHVLVGRDGPIAPWANYRSHVVSLAEKTRSSAASVDAPPLLFPEEDPELDVVRGPLHGGVVASPVARAIRVTAVALGAAGALFGGYRALARQPAGEGNDPARAVAADPLERLDRLGDTVAFAVAAFDLRMRLFYGHKMSCTDLAQGLVDLEARWMARTSVRRVIASMPDSTRAVHDAGMSADVGAVERRFAGTGCPRP